jgi:hypothetical protein
MTRHVFHGAAQLRWKEAASMDRKLISELLARIDSLSERVAILEAERASRHQEDRRNPLPPELRGEKTAHSPQYEWYPDPSMWNTRNGH